ncbi:MAG: hypothetical protein ACXV8L_17220 [Ilumatobacteraceae bacterium]
MAKATAVDEVEAMDPGVVANSRLTASVGAILLVALFIEGITVLDVNGMFALHAFVGMLLIPVAVLKLCSTGYRFWKYYTGDPAYRRKGPPHIILRVTAPVVVISTIALLGTGAALLAVGPNNADTLVTFHQASFVVWVSVTTIHVLGHIVETWRLTGDDLRATSTAAVPRVGIRRALLLVSLVIGVGLGVASLGWNHDWANRRHFKRDGAGRGSAVARPAETLLERV